MYSANDLVLPAVKALHSKKKKKIRKKKKKGGVEPVPALVDPVPCMVEPVPAVELPPVALAVLNEHTLRATQRGEVPWTDAAILEQKSSAEPTEAHSPEVVEEGVVEAWVTEAGVTEAGVVELEVAGFTSQILALSASDR
uniref:Uncharacterized protein n=1 Tax=Cacopsylla melanoneura TaxID=428564 RepID=A0A8D8LFF3_9HEMI